MSFFTILVAPLCLAKRFNAEEVMDMLQTLQAKVQTLENENEMLKATTGERFDRIEQTLETTNRATVNTLFLATIAADSIAISDGEPIIFDTAPINNGGHYNTELGAYTAPYSGYYQFSVAKRSNNHRAHFWLLIDEEKYFYNQLLINDGSDTPTGTVTISIQLTAGQRVRVENQSSTLIYGTDSSGTISSYFTGYMLYLL